MQPNAYEALHRRATLTWRGPALMLFARTVCAIAAQAAFAPVFALRRSTSLAIVLVAFAWSLQHVFMPLIFDAKFMGFRLLSSGPHVLLPLERGG